MDERRRFLESSYRSVDRVERSPFAPPVPGIDHHLISVISVAARHRRRMLVAVFLITLLGVFAGLLLRPERYDGRMKFIVKNVRLQLPVTGEAQIGGLIREGVSDTNVNSEIELLTSRDVLKRVVEVRELANKNGAEEPDRRPALISRTISDLAKDLEVEQVKRSSIIAVSYRSASRNQTLGVLQALASAYFEKHVEAHSSSGAYEFFGSQLKQSEDRLEAALDARSQFQKANPDLILLDQKKVLRLERLSEAESAYQEVDAEYKQASNRVAQLRALLPHTRERVVTQSRVMPNQYSIERLQTMLVELENKKTQLDSRMQPGDRLVVEVEKQIADTAAALNRVSEQKLIEEATDVNPLHAQLESDLSVATVNQAGLAERRQSAGANAMRLKGSLARLESASASYDALRRDVEEAKADVALLTKKREEARVAEALDAGKIMNVSLIEEPNILSERSNPAASFAIAFAVALFFSFTALVALQLLRPAPGSLDPFRPAVSGGSLSEPTDERQIESGHPKAPTRSVVAGTAQ